jgi:medium-chain acyl-[acyl-carrier-protein] hydrolase
MVQHFFNQKVSQSNAMVRLFCLPYAGGNGAMFRGWQSQSPAWLQICPIELPGRGWRSADAMPQSIPELAHDIAYSLHAHSNIPFALFGHSMGASIAYEVVRALEKLGNRELFRLIVSAARAPFLDRLTPRTSDLSDGDFLEHIRNLGATPSEVLANPELMAVLLPMLRVDFAICERYSPNGVYAIKTPLTAFAGTEDPDIPVSDVEAWGRISAANFGIRRFPGGHFFIKSNEAAVVAAVVNELRGVGC